jgi:hypothetical protein
MLFLYRSGALSILMEVTQEYGTDLLAIREVKTPAIQQGQKYRSIGIPTVGSPYLAMPG